MSEKALVRKNNFASKVRYWLNAPSRLMIAVYTSFVCGLSSVSPTFCTSSSTSSATNNMNALFSSMVNIICDIAFYIGAIIVVSGIFNWVLAQKDENADGQSRAIKFIVVGFVLVSLKFIVSPIIRSLGLTVT